MRIVNRFAGTLLLGTILSPAAHAQAASDSEGIGEIVVTAQKREQSLQDVGMSITAVGAEALERRQLVDVYELVKIVPGLSVTNSGSGPTPVYSLRGVGFNDKSLAASPTVSVYMDEIPMPFPVMTKGSMVDLERLEVYKGPQGTLFGQNATAGAINYIAARPADEFSAKIAGSYGRFDWWNLQGFISGPIADGVRFRAALSHDGGGPWQKSYTHGGVLGRRDFTSGRLSLDLDPSETVRLRFVLSGFKDKSDTQALQFVRYEAQLPPGIAQIIPYPASPEKPRAADWNPHPQRALKFNNEYYQPSLRADIELTPEVTLTSLTSYNDYKQNSYFDGDGTSFEIIEYQQIGRIKAFNQELRLSGDTGRLNWIVGANYARDRVWQNEVANLYYLSNVQDLAGFSQQTSPVRSLQRDKSLAVFGNLEYRITDQVTVLAGARYTDTRTRWRGCTYAPNFAPRPDTPVPGVTGDSVSYFNVLYQIVTGNTDSPIVPNGCITLDALSGTNQPTDSPSKLYEDNVSWTATVNYKPDQDTLIYGRVAKGYKSGSFPTTGAAFNQQYLPAKQEALLSYEAGLKLMLANRSLQLDAAAFYYDYTDKQLSTFIVDAVFGPLVAIRNVPKSRVIGAEAAATWIPVGGLTFSGALTYVDTKIKRFEGYTPTGVLQDFAGAAFNLTPKWSGNLDAIYNWSVADDMDAFVGGGMTYRSKTAGVIGTNDPDFDIDAYTIFDAQVGIKQKDGRWSARLFGNNITNKYSWNNVNRVGDSVVRVANLPATYGISASFGF